MAQKITRDERRRRIGVRHLLASAHSSDDVLDVAGALVALHSSDPATVYLSATARMTNPTISAVERALYDDRSIVRHHAMRRTIWVMPVAHARRAHGATTEKIAASEARRTEKAIEASTDIADPVRWLANAKQQVVALLNSEGTMTTREVGAALPHLAIPLQFGSAKHSATLNAHTKILQGAGFDASVVRGRQPASWVSAEYPWSATEAWLGQPISGMEKRQAAAELVDAWLWSFGPGTETDLVWWFGDTKSLIRNALADCRAVEVELEDGSPAWVAEGDIGRSEEPAPWVRLLPGLDPTSMGWKERDFYLDPKFVEPMFDRFGNIGPSIWADGRIVGGWAQQEDATVVLELFTSLSKDHRKLLDEAIEQVHDVVDGVQVKPRFPAKLQKALLS